MVKLEVGKFYRARDGRKVGPIMSYRGWGKFTYGVGEQRYSESGIDGWETEDPTYGDLIAEWQDDPAEVIGENVRVIPIDAATDELFERMAETREKPYEVIGSDVESINAATMPESLLDDLQAAYPQPRSKYHRIIKGVEVDIYDILVAWGVTCPARQHAIKKLLMAGERGAKGVAQDLDEAIQATERAKELVKQ